MSSGTFMLCVHRDVSITTMSSLFRAVGPEWGIMVEFGDALVSRARSRLCTRWLDERPNDDVCMMVDDDIKFSRETADAVAAVCREKRGIAAALMSTRDGTHLTAVSLDGGAPKDEGGDEPIEVRWITGFVAYHRDIFEHLSKELPLLHRKEGQPFYPFFMPGIIEMNGQQIYMGEDYAFAERARTAGFKSWLVPTVSVGHITRALVTPDNMGIIAALAAEGKAGNL